MSKRIAVILLALCLPACSPNTGESVLDNYLSRLEKVLSIDPTSLNNTNTGNQNAILDVTYHHWGFSGATFDSEASPNQSISILDFLSLYGCDLQMVVAEGNSSLGKFAPTSQVLIRQLRFLHFAPKCIEKLDPQDDVELITQLKREQSNKLDQLNPLIWRAILNEDEARQFWRKPASLGDYPSQVSIDPELAIRRLGLLADTWKQGDYLQGVNELERLLSDLRAGDGGALIQAYGLLQRKLNKANQMLKSYLKSEQCLRGRPAIDPKILRNVVEKFFVGEVQIWASELNRRVYSLIHAYQGLEGKFVDVETDSYRSWREQRDAFFEVGIGATAEHVGLVQKSLERCSK